MLPLAEVRRGRSHARCGAVRCGGSTERCDAVQCSAMPRKAHRRRREDSGALRQFIIISLRGQWLIGGGGGGGRRLTNLNVFALVVVGHGHVGSIYTMVEKGRWGLLYVSGLYRVCTSIQQYATRSNTTVRTGAGHPRPRIERDDLRTQFACLHSAVYFTIWIRMFSTSIYASRRRFRTGLYITLILFVIGKTQIDS